METRTVTTRVERSIAETLAKWADERELLMSELLRYLITALVNGEYDTAFHNVAFDAAATAIVNVRPDMSDNERNQIVREIAKNWREDFAATVEAGNGGYLSRAYPEGFPDWPG